jgi:hypothetical protein
MKNILDKINKAHEVEATKLAKHEVELAIVQDIIKLFSDGQNLASTAGSMVDSSAVKFADALKPLEQAKKLIEKVLVDAKSLGVEIPKETLTIFNKVDEFIKYSKNSINTLNKI